MAPLTRRQKKALADAAAPPPPAIDPARPPAVSDHADRISKLPTEIQAHILSLVPAQEAVRTCVLGRTWSNVWKSTRRLLITGKSVQEVKESVDRLLRVRRDGLKQASLDVSDGLKFECLDESEIRFDPFVEVGDDVSAIRVRVRFCQDICRFVDVGDDWQSEDMRSINRWIHEVLKCQIQTLLVDINAESDFEAYLHMSRTPLLVSGHLTSLQLTGIMFDCRCIDLDGCPELKHLEINECCFVRVRKITSLSLSRLVITSCRSNGDRDRIWICAPRLVSLLLDHMDFRTPLLERMPELVAAKVQIHSYQDGCDCKDPMACFHVMRDGDTSDIDSDSDDEEGSGDYTGQNTTKCVVLEGLAQAKDLVLVADRPTYIFRRDLRWCPTFSNLRTLVLIEKYRREPADLSVLECMLEHAPLLEKLTLTLEKVVPSGGKFKVEIKGYPDANVKSTKISQHLQIVKINYEDVNGICLNLLNFLATHNICYETRVTKNDEEITILRNR